jgi:hypothetical protein
MLIFLLYNSKGNEVEAESCRVKARRLWLTWSKKNLFSFASILLLFYFCLLSLFQEAVSMTIKPLLTRPRQQHHLSYSCGHQVRLSPTPSNIKFCWKRIREKPRSSRS